VFICDEESEDDYQQCGVSEAVASASNELVSANLRSNATTIPRDPESVWTLRELEWRNRPRDPRMSAHDAARRVRTAIEAAESELRRIDVTETVEPYPLFLFDRRRRE